MKNLFVFIQKHSFFLAIFFILFSAIVLRTYNISERINYGSDSTRDALIAKEALVRHEVPLIGSFSSAGPFVFGPIYFWFNMAALTLMPFSFKTPWILLNMVSVLMVIVMMLAGLFVGGKKLAVVVGLFAAFSPQFISRATGLSQHAYVGIASSCLLLFFILFWKKKNLIYPFLMGISFGVALSMHYQALNFAAFAPFLLFVPHLSIKRKLIAVFLFFFGFFIPSLPLLYWDSQQQFTNIRNILDYVLIGQYRIYVPNSWTLFLFRFLPDYWSNVVGGNKVISGIIMGITMITFILMFLKRKIPGEILSLGVIFFILLIFIRYYRGERFDGYMIYIAPFIFLLSAWALVSLFELIKNSKLGFLKKNMRSKLISSFFVISIAVVLIFDFKNASQFIFNSISNENTVRLAEKILIEKYPNQKFQLYDFYWKTSDYSYALGANLSENGRVSKNGIPIGVMDTTTSPVNTPVIYDSGGWKIVSLETLNNKGLSRPFWVPVNPPDIYDDLMKWQKTEKLASTFSLDKFILEKLHLR